MRAPRNSKSVTLVLVDDHLLFRQSLKAMISGWPGIAVAGDAGDGRQCLQLISQRRPDVAVVDITMDGLNGLELTPRIKEISPRTKVLILTMHKDPEYIHRAMKNGCGGYALKSDSLEELERAIRMVARGQTYLSARISTGFIHSLLAGTASGKGPLSALTAREREVCSLLRQGRNNKQIAVDLGISPKTAGVHLSNIMKKLSCDSRVKLALLLQDILRD